MRKYLMVLLIFFTLVETSGQKFETSFTQALSDTAQYDLVRWADFDNDSLPDVLVSGTDNNQNLFFIIYKSNLTTGLSHKIVIKTKFKKSFYDLTDFDGDNQIDIILSGMDAGGPNTIVFFNAGNFVFDREVLLPIAGTSLVFTDLNQDGQRELIVSGDDANVPFFNIYESKLNQWQLVNDSIKIQASAIEAFDFDNDGDMDFFVSGRNSLGVPTAQLFYNQRQYYFKSIPLSKQIDGRTSVSDLNHDGALDILLAGVDQDQINKSVILVNQKNNFLLKDTLPALSNTRIFSGDMNSDGKCDINLLGTSDSDSLNLILHANGDYDTLNSEGVRAQAFGDFDRDGDLDLTQLMVKGNASTVVILQNPTQQVNQIPGKPFNPIAARIFNRVFLYWRKPVDDHTTTASLSYDINIQTANSDLITATHDQFNFRRLLVNHGNVGTSNYVLLKTKTTGSFNFSIQAVDNAYHAGKGSVCVGSGATTCGELIVENIEACKNERVTLAAEDGAVWFSFNKGLLQSEPVLTITLQKSDTVFSVTSSGNGNACPSIHVYLFEIKDSLTKILNSTLYVCEGAQLNLNVESGWEQVLWSSTRKGFLSDKNEIVFPVAESDTVKVKLSDGKGCNLQRNTVLKISKPVLELEENAFQIMTGESVQLNAVGAETYFWSPALGIDNNTSGNPVASPRQTTDYTVTAKDSVGCEAKGKVLVIVEETAFIPNLFTPNDDGKNDDLKIYGLGNVNNLSFSIFNREGSMIFSTTSISELMGNGWNGMVRGVKQPAGVYYWKVGGETKTGNKILLNGKSTGSIVLIR